MILGTVFKHKVEYPAIEKKTVVTSHLVDEVNFEHDCIMAFVNRGFAEKVVDVAREAGAKGATIMRGRGTDEHQKVMLPLINIELQPEKEIVWFITTTNVSAVIADSLLSNEQLNQDGEIAVFVSPTEAKIRTLQQQILNNINAAT